MGASNLKSSVPDPHAWASTAGRRRVEEKAGGFRIEIRGQGSARSAPQGSDSAGVDDPRAETVRIRA